MEGIAALGLALVRALATCSAAAQSVSNLAALQGLAPFSVLPSTAAGRAALAANLAASGAIQAGALKQPTLLPFPAQQQQSLRDAFITSGDATELSDALGTRLGSAYQALAH